MASNDIQDIIDRLSREMIIPTYTFPTQSSINRRNSILNTISGSSVIHSTISGFNSTHMNDPPSPPLPPRNIIPLPPPYPPPITHNRPLSQLHLPSRVVNFSSDYRQINNNLNNSTDSNTDNIVDDIVDDTYENRENSTGDDIIDEIDHEHDIIDDNNEEFDYLYDCDDNIYDLNNSKMDNHAHFMHTIQHLNKQLHNLYKKNLKLNNDNYYLYNKNKIYINTIQNYKDIIILHKKYIKDLYHTKENRINIYEVNIINLKNLIKSQNLIINKFKDSLKCSICYDNNINIILSPCNHCVMCDSCYNNYIQYDDTCPLCKTYIEDYIKIYLPNLN